MHQPRPSQPIEYAMFVLIIGRELGAISHTTEKKLTESLIEIPSNMSSILELREEIKELSKKIFKAKVYFTWEEDIYPLAMEVH